MNDELAVHDVVGVATAVVAKVQALADVEITDENRSSYIEQWTLLIALGKAIHDTADDLGTAIAKSLPRGETVAYNGTHYKRTRKPTRRNWQHADLLRAVLDSRIFNRETGELIDETPIDKVRAVWPLAGYDARVAALKERQIDPDEYAELEWGPLRLAEVR